MVRTKGALFLQALAVILVVVGAFVVLSAATTVRYEERSPISNAVAMACEDSIASCLMEDAPARPAAAPVVASHAQ